MKSHPPDWSPVEDDILRKNYQTEKSVAHLVDLLPGRSESGINQRAARLGIKRRADVRSAILASLAQRGEATSYDVASDVGLDVSTIRHYLRDLKNAKLVHKSDKVIKPNAVFRCQVVLWAAGDGTDAVAPKEWHRSGLKSVDIPPRDEITAALFGSAPAMSAPAITGRLIMQEMQ
ncbi:ArsR family transcriptional regulator [Burkholderia gladioli]|uniref:ArsR family transcriptional regulator n=1 Tax=Burkholderia gladioli TaxID=28095 RepID=UPI001640D516|nr:ArsR family transcriptional regulator [Burkholderia gladioli]